MEYRRELGDAGSSPAAGSSSTFSVSVPAGASLVVVVNEVTSGTAVPDYTIIVSGLPCPPPVLNIQPVPTEKAKVFWPTYAGGYRLEGTPSLSPTNWATITNEPMVQNGLFIGKMGGTAQWSVPPGEETVAA